MNLAAVNVHSPAPATARFSHANAIISSSYNYITY
jgi:hypothetical protein